MNLFGITALAAAGDNADMATTAGAVGGMSITTILMFVLIIAMFYFMIIRPQKKREKETKAMLNAMKVGDKVVTIGGICGKVVKIKDNYVYLETGTGKQEEMSYLKMERDAVKTVEKKQSN